VADPLAFSSQPQSPVEPECSQPQPLASCQDKRAPEGMTLAAWAKVLAINAQFLARLSNGVPNDQVVCEAIGQCFDVLFEDHLEKKHDEAAHVLMGAIRDQTFAVAGTLAWLPEAIAAHPSILYQEWFWTLLVPRMQYYEARLLGRSYGDALAKPDLVVRPIPDPVIAMVESDDALKKMNSQPLKDILEEVVRRGIEAQGIPPESSYDLAFLLEGARLAKHYGPVRILFQPEPVDRLQKESILEGPPPTMMAAGGTGGPAANGVPPAEAKSQTRGIQEPASSAIGPSPEESPKISERRKERRGLRDQYKTECKLQGVTVTDKMIAEAASSKWHCRTTIQKWLACDPRYDGESDRLIRSVFVRKPHISSTT
jgi:hypothetical protein